MRETLKELRKKRLEVDDVEQRKYGLRVNDEINVRAMAFGGST